MRKRSRTLRKLGAKQSPGPTAADREVNPMALEEVIGAVESNRHYCKVQKVYGSEGGAQRWRAVCLMWKCRYQGHAKTWFDAKADADAHEKERQS